MAITEEVVICVICEEVASGLSLLLTETFLKKQIDAAQK
jgi:hypothetical protein